ncbi:TRANSCRIPTION FACTOR MYB114-LIKE [Salix purpurea]|uniref:TRANSCRIPTION FACTOR MYB114-LIKE n=1 Tax=Salix purpurea TaxID=77065 RepID=A0A9Q0T9P1_SALPP|nr:TRANSCRIPTION FACTOR MYB114-LIKE [Salix purpurea]
MAPTNAVTDASPKKVMSRGAWTAEEDSKLARCVEVHGAKRWKTVALKSGQSRSVPVSPHKQLASSPFHFSNYVHFARVSSRYVASAIAVIILGLLKSLLFSYILQKITNQTGKEKMADQPSTPLAIDEVESSREARNLETGNFDVNEFLDFSAEGSEWVDKSLQLDGIQWIIDGEEVSIL